MKVRVAVVGGGLGGLLTASELQAAGVDDVVVLDRDDLPGGVARTVARDGYQLEPAAGALLLPKPELSPVLANLGAEVVPAVDAALRYVYARGRLNVLGPSPKVVLSPVVTWPAKFRALAEPFIRTRAASSDESVDAFFRRRFGKGMGGTLAWLAASGVFAGDPARLSARSAFPVFSALEDEAGSLVRGGIRRARRRERGTPRAKSHVPVGGFSALAERAARRLGDRYRPGVTIESVRRSDRGWDVKGSERPSIVPCPPRPSSSASVRNRTASRCRPDSGHSPDRMPARSRSASSSSHRTRLIGRRPGTPWPR